MRNYRQAAMPTFSCLIILLLLSIACSPGHCRGAPRVKGVSSARATRKSGRYGSTGSSGFSSLPLLIRSRFSFMAKVMAYRTGMIFASRDWRAGHPDYSDSMTLCFNVQDHLPSEYLDSVLLPWHYQNRTALGLYVCPIDSQPEKLYCCGSDNSQYCCTFWDDSSRLSSVAVGTTLAILSCLLFGAWLYRWSQRRLRWKNQAQSQVDLLYEPPPPTANDTAAAVQSRATGSRQRPMQLQPRRHQQHQGGWAPASAKS